MKITIKTPEEIEILIKGGKILATILQEVGRHVQIGVSTAELDQIAEKLILEAGGIPSFKGYGEPDPFPATLCTSINEEIVHAIPSNRKLQDGDIIGLDIGMKWPAQDGLFTDHAITFAVANVSAENLKLMEVTQGCLNKAISILKPGMYVNDIGRAIEKYVQEHGNYGIVRDLTGHGVGYKVHEPPTIVNYALSERGAELKEGMVIAIEPMLTLGTWKIKVADNGWSIVTQDNSFSAHFEHTIVITKNASRIITQV